MPLMVYLVGACIFAMTTGESMVSGLLPELADGLGVSIPQAGYLISAYAVAMAIGGPLVTMALIRVPRPRAMPVLLGGFLVGQLLGATALNFPMMVLARVLAGAAEGAFFGVGLSLAVAVVGTARVGRAASVIVGGITMGTVVGLPLTTLIGQRAGWRAAFCAVAAAVLVVGALVRVLMPTLVPAPGGAAGDTDGVSPLRSELAQLANRRLWAVYFTSGLLIGSVFAAFSYYTVIFTRVAGIPLSLVPALLTGYGIATVVGNLVVGRLADRYTMPLLAGGLAALAVLFVGFATGATHPVVALAATLGIGLVGLPMNSATVARRMRVAPNSALVNTVSTSVINVGIAVGPAGWSSAPGRASPRRCGSPPGWRCSACSPWRVPAEVRAAGGPRVRGELHGQRVRRRCRGPRRRASCPVRIWIDQSRMEGAHGRWVTDLSARLCWSLGAVRALAGLSRSRSPGRVPWWRPLGAPRRTLSTLCA
jgi:predicted MFS family arabinose efflux permease